MDMMKELYEKVAKDSALQAKFAEIMKDVEKAGPEATGKKLVVFAKEAGYDLTLEEIQDFFSKLESKTENALSEEELDAVAGGKVSPGITSLAYAGIQGCKPMLSNYEGINPQCLKINL